MSPKQRIQANDSVAEEIRKIMHGATFETAHEAAMLEFVNNQNRGNEGASAIASHFELEGAKRFLSILLKIADAAVPHGTQGQSGQLDHVMEFPKKK